MNKFLGWADRRNLVSVRATVLGVTVWMTWRVTVWAFDFSAAWLASDKDGLQAAAILVAVTAPISALQVFAFKSYMTGADK